MKTPGPQAIFTKIIPPKPKSWLGQFEEKMAVEVEIIGYTPFGDLLLRAIENQSLAIMFTQPLQVSGVDGKDVDDVNRLLSGIPEAVKNLADAKLIAACAKLHGPLRYEEIYTCEPFRFLGGDKKPKNRPRAALWTYIELVSACQ